MKQLTNLASKRPSGAGMTALKRSLKVSILMHFARWGGVDGSVVLFSLWMIAISVLSVIIIEGQEKGPLSLTYV